MIFDFDLRLRKSKPTLEQIITMAKELSCRSQHVLCVPYHAYSSCLPDININVKLDVRIIGGSQCVKQRTENVTQRTEYKRLRSYKVKHEHFLNMKCTQSIQLNDNKMPQTNN